jgi:hypothetical protein
MLSLDEQQVFVPLARPVWAEALVANSDMIAGTMA